MIVDKKPELKLINMADVEATEVKWLWYPYIPYGKITIIQGDPGEGKTTLVLNLAAILSRGDKLPETTKDAEPINIIYQTAEDGLADTVKPRLIAADADYKRITVIDESICELSFTDDRLEHAIIETKVKLVILDPLQAYIGASVDMHRAKIIESAATTALISRSAAGYFFIDNIISILSRILPFPIGSSCRNPVTRSVSNSLSEETLRPRISSEIPAI